MSEFSTPLTVITAVIPHPNADKLDIVKCYDYCVVARKGQYKVGDQVFYCSIDTILPEKLEAQLFPPDSKIKLTKGRIKAIKIRSYVSQGMILSIGDVATYVGISDIGVLVLEKDYSSLLGTTKHTPPVPEYKSKLPQAKKVRPQQHPMLHQYNGLEHLSRFNKLFSEEDEVVVECKLHGSNGRISLLPAQPTSLWKRIKLFLGFVPKFEIRYGSNEVELTEKVDYKGFYGGDVWARAFTKINAAEKLKPYEVVYGEIIGKGIQKWYDYGHEEPHFVIFDVKKFEVDGSWRWFNPEEVEAYAKERGFDMVPILYRGKFNKDVIDSLVSGDSVYCPTQKIREGVVVKKRFDYTDMKFPSSKGALKLINPEYLLKDNTDFN